MIDLMQNIAIILLTISIVIDWTIRWLRRKSAEYAEKMKGEMK